MEEVPGKALPCPSFSCPSLWMDLDASTLRFNFTETKKENEGERKRSIERLWVEKCPAGREGAFNTISCHLHLENVRTDRRGFSPLDLFAVVYCQSCLYTVAIDETTSRHAIARISFPFNDRLSWDVALLRLAFEETINGKCNERFHSKLIFQLLDEQVRLQRNSSGLPGY